MSRRKTVEHNFAFVSNVVSIGVSQIEKLSLRADKQAVIDQLPETHTEFVKGIYKKYDIPPATKPGMRSRFLRSDEITNRQVEDLIASKLVTPEQVRAAGLQA